MDEPLEDFNAAWGGNEWAAADDDPFAPKATKGSSNFDLNADPDFEGWLNAQSQTRTGKKPLPKGLTKSKTSTRQGLAKTNSAGKALPKSTLATRPKPAPKAKLEDEDWGDSWD
jgi:SCY1-like protein 1